MARACPFYGLPQGCRHGRRCRDWHVTHDGTLAVTRAAPQDDMRSRDSWRCRVHDLLQRRLREQGSRVEITGSSYTRSEDEARVRFTVRGMQAPSEATWEAVRQGGMAGPDGHFVRPSGAIGPGAYSRMGDQIIFFHGKVLI